MKTWQAWVLGTAIIVTSIGSCTVQTFTGKATTETYVEAGQGVKKGVDVIRNGRTGDFWIVKRTCWSL